MIAEISRAPLLEGCLILHALVTYIPVSWYEIRG